MASPAPSSPAADEVQFLCVKEGRDLRIRIVSPGYLPGANCQFPRGIRREGGRYSSPASAVKTRRSPKGTYFYSVTASAVREVAPSALDLSGVKVFADEAPECAICMDAPKTLVFVPCGHFCSCEGCFPSLKRKCPMCRAAIDVAVDRSQIA